MPSRPDSIMRDRRKIKGNQTTNGATEHFTRIISIYLQLKTQAEAQD
jgi:hypothetical protein